eukprot:1144237_1
MSGYCLCRIQNIWDDCEPLDCVISMHVRCRIDIYLSNISSQTNVQMQSHVQNILYSLLAHGMIQHMSYCDCKTTAGACIHGLASLYKLYHLRMNKQMHITNPRTVKYSPSLRDSFEFDSASDGHNWTRMCFVNNMNHEA